MGRKNCFNIQEYFIVAEDKSKATCTFPNCKAEFKGVCPGNLKRHAMTVHKVSNEQASGSGIAKKKL